MSNVTEYFYQELIKLPNVFFCEFAKFSLHMAQEECPVYHWLFHQGQIIAALTTGRVISTKIIKGTVHGNKFTDFVQGK